jgi:hypothetical protein
MMKSTTQPRFESLTLACRAIVLAGALVACSSPAGDEAAPSSAAHKALSLEAQRAGSIVDDFASGADVLAVPFGPATLESVQAGDMLGGGRFLRLIVANDPRHQPTWLDVNPDAGGYASISLGAQQDARVEIVYGYQADGAGGGVERALTETGDGDLLAQGSVLRTHFDSVNSVQPLNFSVVAITDTGLAEAGINASSSVNPFDVDFRFGGAGPADAVFIPGGDQPADFSRVQFLAFVLQFSGDVVLSSIEIL